MNLTDQIPSALTVAMLAAIAKHFFTRRPLVEKPESNILEDM